MRIDTEHEIDRLMHSHERDRKQFEVSQLTSVRLFDAVAPRLSQTVYVSISLVGCVSSPLDAAENLPSRERVAAALRSSTIYKHLERDRRNASRATDSVRRAA